MIRACVFVQRSPTAAATVPGFDGVGFRLKKKQRKNGPAEIAVMVESLKAASDRMK